MSYDIYLYGPECPTCKHRESGPYLPNPTYNLSPIFDLAITGEPYPGTVNEARVVLLGEETVRPWGLRGLFGRKAGDTVKELEVAVARLHDPKWRSRFIALEPSNKWGDLPDAVEVMETLLKAARECPEMTWEIR